MKKPFTATLVLIVALIAVFSVFAVTGGIDGKRARILFVGDMMFDRTIRSIAEKSEKDGKDGKGEGNAGYDRIFSCIADYLDGFDMVVGNLEGPITPEASKSAGTKPGEPGNTAFTFSPAVAQALADHNVGVVSLGNNHIYDFGAAGERSTKEALMKAGVLSFGSPSGPLVATTTVGGVRLALVGFNQFLGQGDESATIRAVRAAKKDADKVIVFAHWGEEYVPATSYQTYLAHAFADAGADIVIGSHPHVIQSSEDYAGSKIYYSLGNFIFDQYWTESVRTGLGVEATIKDGEVSFREARFDIGRDGATCLLD